MKYIIVLYSIIHTVVFTHSDPFIIMTLPKCNLMKV